MKFTPIPAHLNFKDITNQKFGRLKVLGYAGNYEWWCKCECGKVKRIRSGNLRGNTTKSCGCLNSEMRSKTAIKTLTTNGLSKHPLYKTWSDMIQRCYNKNNNTYPKYGGRGIRVCKRWKDPIKGPKRFIKDMGPKPSPSHSIDRYPKQKGNYEPGNCRWATKRQQASNRMSNRIVTWKGKKYILARLIRKLNKQGYSLTYNSVMGRLNRGWSLKKAINNN